MACFMCFTENGSLQRLQTDIDIGVLKKISFILPDLAIPDTNDPTYACAACLQDVTTFYEIKFMSLGNYCRMNCYRETLEEVSDVKFNELKIAVASHEISAKRKLDTEHKINTNCNDLLSSADENEFTKEDSNLSDGGELEQSSSKKRRFKCHDCDKTFTWRHHLKTHTRVHSGERPYKCGTCQKTFSQSGTLRHHTLIHTGEKPHECDVCQKTFTHKTTLIRHKGTHSGERPYECAVCSKAFTQSSNLSVHMRTHTGQKPHQCQVCQYRCARATHLTRHMRTHTADKPYICNLCNKLFAQSSNLNKHKRRLHNNEHLN